MIRRSLCLVAVAAAPLVAQQPGRKVASLDRTKVPNIGPTPALRVPAWTKTTLANVPYDASSDQFLRIRREANTASGTIDVVFETASNNGGVPGVYSVRYRESWSTSVVPNALKCELKAGTSVAEVAPGTVVWDHVHVATDSK